MTVESHTITEITVIEHLNDRGASAESITDTIINQQKIDVDTMAGATNSSTVIKKAVENAILTAAETTITEN